MSDGEHEFSRNNSVDSSGEREISMEKSVLVGTHIGFDGGELSTDARGEISMARFAEVTTQGYKDLETEIQKMGSEFFGYFDSKDTNSTRRYITDVVLFDNERKLYQIVGRLCEYGKLRRTGMFGYSVEEDHVHIIHDCSFSDGTCRCSWRKQVESIGKIKPLRKENKPIWQFKRSDWYDVFVYFFLRKRGDRKIWFRGIDWREPSLGKCT